MKKLTNFTNCLNVLKKHGGGVIVLHELSLPGAYAAYQPISETLRGEFLVH